MYFWLPFPRFFSVYPQIKLRGHEQLEYWENQLYAVIISLPTWSWLNDF